MRFLRERLHLLQVPRRADPGLVVAALLEEGDEGARGAGGQLAKTLPLAGQPLLEQVAVLDVETRQELAAIEPLGLGERAQRVLAAPPHSGPHRLLEDRRVEPQRSSGVQTDLLLAGEQPLGGGGVAVSEGG